MPQDDSDTMKALLAQLHGIHEELARRHAGVCVLHIEAAIASLESRVARDLTERRNPAFADDLRVSH